MEPYWNPEAELYRLTWALAEVDEPATRAIEAKCFGVFAALAHPELGPLDPDDEDVLNCLTELDDTLAQKLGEEEQE